MASKESDSRKSGRRKPGSGVASGSKSSRNDPKKKVVIVGGGCAALTAAFELTSGKNKDKFDVTVYTMGWRLGGKGASGRNVHRSNRIEEHGLHVWMGFYENAFRIIRECYEELNADGKPRRFGNWQEAFFPETSLGTVEKMEDGTWSMWSGQFAPTVGLPGDPLKGSENPFTLTSYFVRTIELTRSLLFSVQTGLAVRSEESPGKRSLADVQLDKASIEFTSLSPASLVYKITQLVRMGSLATFAGLFQALLILEVYIKKRQNLLRFTPKIIDLIEAIVVNLRRQFEDLANIDPQLRRKTVMIDVTMTIMFGLVKDGVFSNPKGLDCINEFDCRAWLEKHGASRQSVDSPLVRALYSIAFADLPGERGTLAAGQAIRGALRMFFTYRGSLTWKMRGGMGDVVFAPLYQVLTARKVKFRFFHRLEEVELGDGDDANRVVALRFHKQLSGNVSNYKPLIDIAQRSKSSRRREYLCWPSEPNWGALEGAEKIPEYRNLEDSEMELTSRNDVTLVEDKDFQFVVLAVDVGTIRRTCTAITDRYQRWAEMVRNVKTGTTMALQLWLTKDLQGPGWDGGPVTMSGLPSAMDAFSQMNHLVPEESWNLAPESGEPKSVLYFCGVMDEKKIRDVTPQTEGNDEVESVSVRFLDSDFVKLLRGAGSPDAGPAVFPWDDVYSPDSALVGPLKLTEQFFRANHRGADRYVLSRPGTLRYRISPLDVEIENLTIAGDWTDCGFNEGCVEAAVMSGRLASHALSTYPPLDEIIGYDHP